MGDFYRRFRGTTTSAGMIRMEPEPDFGMGKNGWSAYLAVMGVKHITLQVEGLDGAVELQGCNGRPTDETEWYTIEELTADGRIVSNEDPIDFIRVNATTVTSGEPIATLTLGS